MKAARTRSADKARRKTNGNGDVGVDPGVRKVAGIAVGGRPIPTGKLIVPKRDWREKLEAQKTIRQPTRQPSVRQVMRQVDLDSTPLRRAFGPSA